MTLRCIACRRPLIAPASTLERGGRTGNYGPKCVAKVGIPMLPLERKPSGRVGKVRGRKAKPDGAQMALDLEPGEVA
jgi:hypothetical protein